MRVAATIIGTLVAVWTLVDVWASNLNFSSNPDEENAARTAAGLTAVGLCAIASVIVTSMPRTSVYLYLLAALPLFGIALLVSKDVERYWIYGTVMLGLAALARGGWLAKRRDERRAEEERARQEARDTLLNTLLQQAQGGRLGTSIACPACGTPNTTGLRFCGACAAQLADTPAPD